MTKLCAELTWFVSSWKNALVESSSRPRVERSSETATLVPSTVAYPSTGPWTVSRKTTGWSGEPDALSTPASNVVIARQAPLTM